MTRISRSPSRVTLLLAEPDAPSYLTLGGRRGDAEAPAEFAHRRHPRTLGRPCLHTSLAFLISQLSGIVEPPLLDCQLLGHLYFPQSLGERLAIDLSSGAGALDAAPHLIDIEPKLIESLRGRGALPTS